ncbi:MAG: LacI family DNA-binding transcriptional regulator [Mycoplasmatales bacterium]
MKKITLQDIADEMGISKSTVSRALRNKEDISRQLKRKINVTATKLGYKLTKDKTNTTIAIICNALIEEPGEDFYNRMYRKISHALSLENFNLKFELFIESPTHELPISANDQMIDGIIVIGEFSNKFFKHLAKRKLPTIVVDYNYDKDYFTTISTNNFASGVSATKYLIKLGHKKICFVGDKEKTNNVLERYYGYVMAMETNNLQEHCFLVMNKDCSFNHKVETTAYFCHTDREAFDLINYLNSINVKVPEDVSVVGFDNTFYSEYSKVKISTMNVDIDLFANKAVEALMKQLGDEEFTHEKITITSSIVEKESVRKL